jgi:hypothetical protein
VSGSTDPMGRFTSDDFDCGSAATTMSEAPENHARGVGWSSRQLLSNISAMVQLMLRLGGVPTGSANVADSRRHWWACSMTSAFFVPNVDGNENERRKVSMLSTRRFATKLRGRAGNTCTRWALIGEPCKKAESVWRVFSDSTEPEGVDKYIGLGVKVVFLRGSVGRALDGAAGATRKGRVIVVTRMTCLRRDLSDMSEGR